MRLKPPYLGILLFVAILILVIGVKFLIQNPVKVVQPIHFEPTVLVPASQEPPLNATEEYERLKALKYEDAQQAELMQHYLDLARLYNKLGELEQVKTEAEHRILAAQYFRLSNYYYDLYYQLAD